MTERYPDLPDWNDDPPSPSSSREPTSQSAPDLPEVRALLADGWQLAPEAPLFAFLPAVWPREHRIWVHDRSTHYSEEFVDGGPGRLVVADRESVEMFDNDMAALCESAGVPSRPADRVWLLRVPAESRWTVEDVLGEIRRRARAAGVPVRTSRQFTDVAVRTVQDMPAGR
ncbi:hypothetical protein GCM10027062_15430 [Nocardioides hungaricus]